MDSPKAPTLQLLCPWSQHMCVFPKNAKTGSPLSCSTARVEGCSCRTHGQVWWPKDGKGILGWAQPRDQLLHPSPGRGQGQCTSHSRARIQPCAGAIWAAKLSLPHPPPSTIRQMQSRMALAAATAKGCFARPSSKAEVLLGHPQLPPQPPRASRSQPAADRG